MYSVNVDIITSIFYSWGNQTGIYCVFVKKLPSKSYSKNRMQKYKFNSEKFLEKSHFFKANSETPYHLPFCNIKESKLFSIPCRTNCNETFFCFVFFPFLYIWLIHKLIFIVWVFSWLKIPALNSPPKIKQSVFIIPLHLCLYVTL